MATLLDRILEEKKYESLTWRPEKPGDLVEGIVLTCGEVNTQNGPKLLIRVRARTVVSEGQTCEPGIYAIWEKAQVRQAAEERRLRAGDWIAIRFLETEKMKTGGTKKLFAIIMERGKHSGEFIPFGAETPRPPADMRTSAPETEAEPSKPPEASASVEKLPVDDDFEDEIPF